LHVISPQEQVAISIRKKIDNAYRLSGLQESSKLSEVMQQLICPRYVIKMAAKHSTVSTFRVYFTINAVMSDVINHWGSHDLIIQPFIRQKHIINPSLLQYHMKSYNGVFKASSIINKTHLDKNC